MIYRGVNPAGYRRRSGWRLARGKGLPEQRDRREHGRRQRIKGDVETEKQKETDAKVARGTALRRCKKSRGNGRKWCSWRQAKREPQRPQSQPVTARSPGAFPNLLHKLFLF